MPPTFPIYTLTAEERVAILEDEWRRLDWTPKQQKAYEAIRSKLSKVVPGNTPGTLPSKWLRGSVPDVSDATVNKVLRCMGFVFYRAGELNVERDQYPEGAWSCSGQYFVKVGRVTYERAWNEDDSPADDLIHGWIARSKPVRDGVATTAVINDAAVPSTVSAVVLTAENVITGDSVLFESQQESNHTHDLGFDTVEPESSPHSTYSTPPSLIDGVSSSRSGPRIPRSLARREARNDKVLQALRRLTDFEGVVSVGLRAIALEAGYSGNNTVTTIRALDDLSDQGEVLSWLKGSNRLGAGERPVPSVIHLAPPQYDNAVRTATNRARLLSGARQEPYTIEEICKRDEWICQLCLRPVNRFKRFPDPMSLSIDHILPLSAGGNDTPANVWVSHLGCNAAKSDDQSVLRRSSGRKFAHHVIIVNVEGDGVLKSLVSE